MQLAAMQRQYTVADVTDKWDAKIATIYALCIIMYLTQHDADEGYRYDILAKIVHTSMQYQAVHKHNFYVRRFNS